MITVNIRCNKCKAGLTELDGKEFSNKPEAIVRWWKIGGEVSGTNGYALCKACKAK